MHVRFPCRNLLFPVTASASSAPRHLYRTFFTWVMSIVVSSGMAVPGFARNYPIVVPLPTGTVMSIHCLPSSTVGEGTPDWFSPVIFSGENPLETWERRGPYPMEEGSRVDAISSLLPFMTNGCQLPLHSNLLRIDTEGNLLVFPAGFPGEIPAQQSIALRMFFVANDTEMNNFEEVGASSDTAALFLFRDYDDATDDVSAHFCVRSIVDGESTWVHTEAEGATFHDSLWCDVCVVLDNAAGQPVRASYYVDGILLKDSNGNGSFPISTKTGPHVAGYITFFGVGHVDSIRGSWSREAGSLPNPAEFTARLTDAMATSALSPLTLTNGIFSLRFDAPCSGTYRVQTAPTPSGPFTDVGIKAEALLGSPVALDVPAPADAGFYRVSLSTLEF